MGKSCLWYFHIYIISMRFDIMVLLYGRGISAGKEISCMGNCIMGGEGRC